MEAIQVHHFTRHSLHGRVAFAAAIGIALALIGNFALVVAVLIDRFGSS